MDLKCKEDFYMLPVFLGGEKYSVRNEYENQIVLINENGDRHYFSKDPSSPTYFGQWFDLVEDKTN